MVWEMVCIRMWGTSNGRCSSCFPLKQTPSYGYRVPQEAQPILGLFTEDDPLEQEEGDWQHWEQTGNYWDGGGWHGEHWHSEWETPDEEATEGGSVCLNPSCATTSHEMNILFGEPLPQFPVSDSTDQQSDSCERGTASCSQPFQFISKTSLDTCPLLCEGILWNESP